MSNEKGFITPFALAIVILLCGYISFQYKALLSEQQFYLEARQQLIIDTLIQRGIVDTIAELESVSIPINQTESDKIIYNDGEMVYSIKHITQGLYQISMNIKTKKDYKKHVTFTYNQQTTLIINWEES
jgi:hypothetical protein